MRFKTISKNAIIKNKYGNYNVEYVPASFKKIQITHEYGSINMNVDKSASYKIDAFGKYGKIFYFENAKVNVFKQKQDLKIQGLVGDDANTQSVVSIYTKYGNVNLKE